MWLAFDLGTSGVRAAVLDNDGKIVRRAVEPYPTHIADGGVVEQEVSDWWRALVAATRVVEGEVNKIVLTGQMQDLILLNERGEPLRPAILYSERADMCRAALEGVAYAYAHALDALLPERPQTFVLTGGGTRSMAWCQLFADVLGQPVSIGEDAENVGVRGALLAARFASGWLKSYAPAGYFPIRTTLTPNPDLAARYVQKYAVFRASYPALCCISPQNLTGKRVLPFYLTGHNPKVP
jgi:sugar (pentulose or hexulose) kinase